MRSKPECSWSPDISQSQGPLYIAISDAIADHIRDGRLRAGNRLPAHRDLAVRLGVDVTTVTRAYAEARRRGLVDSCVGRGTFIRPSATVDPAPRVEPRGIDMTRNRPPAVRGDLVGARLRAGITEVLARESSVDLLGYGDSAGPPTAREAGAQWLKPRLGEVDAARVVVCPGSQGALAATLSALAVPGDIICCPSLTYPGLRMLGMQLGLDLVGLPMDADGLLPDAFEAACLRHRVKAIYCCPTLANPTAEVMPLARRREIVAIARHYGVAMVEDDAYGMLPRRSPPPLTALAPEIAYYIGGLSKVVAPGLRIAYLVAPDSMAAGRASARLRATSLMTAPLMTALATHWITEGTANEILAAIRAESAARQALVAAELPSGLVRTHPESFHLWVSLPSGWSATAFSERSATLGVSVVPADAFAVSLPPPEAVRISLGAAGERARLSEALRVLVDIMFCRKDIHG